jgi:DUF971 family protein
MNTVLKKIKFPEKFLIETIWSDGFQATIKLEILRDNCPCADCNEERNNKPKSFIALDTFKPGKYLIKKINVVGNYAISPIWEDGHESGIYPFEFLRELFERHNLSNEEIERIKDIHKKSKNN